MELGLKDRNAVITGGSMSIGKASAMALAREGVNIALIARGQEALDAAAEEIGKETSVDVLPVSADMTDAEAVDNAAKTIADKFGTVHILINGVGHRMRRMDRQIEWEDADWVADIDVKTVAMLRAIRAFDPHLATDGTGRVINISGVAATLVFHGALTHGINNSAMVHATGYLARDLVEKNVTVNVVVPGLVASEWRHGWAANMGEQQNISPEEFVANYSKMMGILAGTWGQLDEIADVVVFLASDRASYINGTQIVVDGGMSVNPR